MGWRDGQKWLPKRKDAKQLGHRQWKTIGILLIEPTGFNRLRNLLFSDVSLVKWSHQKLSFAMWDILQSLQVRGLVTQDEPRGKWRVTAKGEYYYCLRQADREKNIFGYVGMAILWQERAQNVLNGSPELQRALEATGGIY